MVKEGYASSVAEAAELDVRTVLQALYYENFLSEYEATYLWLNKDG